MKKLITFLMMAFAVAMVSCADENEKITGGDPPKLPTATEVMDSLEDIKVLKGNALNVDLPYANKAAAGPNTMFDVSKTVGALREDFIKAYNLLPNVKAGYVKDITGGTAIDAVIIGGDVTVTRAVPNKETKLTEANLVNGKTITFKVVPVAGTKVADITGLDAKITAAATGITYTYTAGKVSIAIADVNAAVINIEIAPTGADGDAVAEDKTLEYTGTGVASAATIKAGATGTVGNAGDTFVTDKVAADLRKDFIKAYNALPQVASGVIKALVEGTGTDAAVTYAEATRAVPEATTKLTALVAKQQIIITVTPAGGDNGTIVGNVVPITYTLTTTAANKTPLTAAEVQNAVLDISLTAAKYASLLKEDLVYAGTDGTVVSDVELANAAAVGTTFQDDQTVALLRTAFIAAYNDLAVVKTDKTIAPIDANDITDLGVVIAGAAGDENTALTTAVFTTAGDNITFKVTPAGGDNAVVTGAPVPITYTLTIKA